MSSRKGLVLGGEHSDTLIRSGGLEACSQVDTSLHRLLYELQPLLHAQGDALRVLLGRRFAFLALLSVHLGISKVLRKLREFLVVRMTDHLGTRECWRLSPRAGLHQDLEALRRWVLGGSAGRRGCDANDPTVLIVLEFLVLVGVVPIIHGCLDN